jgi:hypothetical protein
MIKAWQDYLSAFEEGYYTEPDEVRELDDERVLVFDQVRGRAKASGVDLAKISRKARPVAGSQ